MKGEGRCLRESGGFGVGSQLTSGKKGGSSWAPIASERFQVCLCGKRWGE